MKNVSIVLVVLLLSSMSIIGQFSNTKNSSSFANLPKERVYVHHNESLLFSGEYLKYKLYCIDKSTKAASEISKVAYVALIDKSGKSVFTHKVRLNDGSGYGDFFIPTSVPTGSYKLLGYSEWMKNFEESGFFQTNVHIINPYQVTSESYLEPKMDSLQEALAANVSIQKSKGKDNKAVRSAFLDLSLDKSEVGKRKKVAVNITADNLASQQGDYAISVRKIDSIPSPERISSLSFYNNYVLKGTNKAKPGAKITHIPELRGEVISGTIVDKEGKQPVAGQRISLSLPGDKFLLKVATSDANGRFKFITEREYDNANAALQILSDDWDQFEVTLDGHDLRIGDMDYSDFQLSKKLNAYILQKSVQNQIENAFKEKRPDSILSAQHMAPYYRAFTASYNLDDYTRFNSIQETIVEVVDQVSIRRLNNGDHVFEIRPDEGFTDLSLLPMVFVDGLFLKRHEDLMDYSAKKIKSISFSRDKVMLGSQAFQGVLFFKTMDGGFYNDFYAPHIQNIELFKPQPQKEYFNQEYSANMKDDRTPDFRHQLLWNPNLDVSNGKKEVVFYTSDVAGEYELVVEGFTSNGNPVSVKERFVVK
ncbi:carboxypeptidase-like regulatory domain-containing protein [Flagellimonas sp. S3867]|uniref:carboxypeptidase-like regulatory domain-containing protein n=1 Tax=Flagellimonas sp. S3867 TaxID=2768063 RepID=UPI0016888E9D|nr:carboxypeptidase-like regulatory domain-containing protein [Flagellimonas sp. S3867]